MTCNGSWTGQLQLQGMLHWAPMQHARGGVGGCHDVRTQGSGSHATRDISGCATVTVSMIELEVGAQHCRTVVTSCCSSAASVTFHS
jgi:hypothetical protein